MKKYIIVGFITLIILFVVLIVILRGGEKVNNKLIYLEYKYNSSYENSYDDSDCVNISISKERGNVVFNYGDGSSKEYKVEDKDFIKLDIILKKYDVLNWDEYDDIEVIDGDNTFISYKYDNGNYGVISREEYPKGKDNVFSDVVKYLNDLKD